MKKISIILACLCLLVTIGFSQSVDYQQGNPKKTQFTLEECLQYAEENNYSLQTAGLNVSASEINLRQAKENIAPSISASASQGLGTNHYQKSVSWNGNYGINANMTLFNGLSNYNNIQKNKLLVDQSNLELEQGKNNIRVSIIQAFLNIMMNEDLLVYQEDVLKSSKEQMDQGEQQFQVGQILESDYKMLQAQYTSDRFNMENTKINIQNNYLTLKNLLSINPSAEISIVRPDSATLFRSLEVPELQEVMNQSMNYLPTLKISENEVTSAEYDVKIQKANYYPSLGLNAGISTGYNNNNLAENTGWGTQLWHGLGENVGLNLSIPIYNRSSVRHSVQQAQLRVQQAELSQKETEYQVSRELQQYYLDVLSAQNDYRVAEAQKDAYEANYKAYTFKFKYGSVTAVDLIQQQTNYLNQLNRYMQAKYTYVLERKILDVYMGIPVRL
ncbi:MAG: TolC family protein [Bacteroidales bacterium]|nr:TolC family protein [Bacteroidales bacterium]